jgi:hypothetical protein
MRVIPFTDDFVRAIMDIYDETPVRQGRLFWHYHKNFDEAKRANATYLERSEFVGAYLGDELVGFLKIVYVDRIARLMQIIAKDANRGQRPTNALIAKAVELAAARGCSLLTFGKYRYSQGADGVTAFKSRNGQVNAPHAASSRGKSFRASVSSQDPKTPQAVASSARWQNPERRIDLRIIHTT